MELGMGDDYGFGLVGASFADCGTGRVDAINFLDNCLDNLLDNPLDSPSRNFLHNFLNKFSGYYLL